MTRLAIRNLFQNKTRLVISVGGVALALLLILSLDAIFAGVERQVTAYIDHSGADVIVSQSGVRTMHMAASSLPATLVEEVQVLRGVESVTPILYVTNVVSAGEESNLAYVIGLPPAAQAGGPWEGALGAGEPALGEAIIDRGVAQKSGVGLNDEVEILGQRFDVVGLSRGTANFVNSVAFISIEDFARLRAGPGAVSFLMVKLKDGESPEAVAQQIERQFGGVTAQTRQEFTRQERRVIKDMSTDVIAIMNLVGFLIGLAVMALTVYTATLARRAEYGVLKALGARGRQLVHTVVAQALLSVALGFVLGLGFTVSLGLIIPRVIPNLSLLVSWASLLKVGSASLLIAAVSAILPIRQIARLDPAMVFRRM